MIQLAVLLALRQEQQLHALVRRDFMMMETLHFVRNVVKNVKSVQVKMSVKSAL
jgi:hypothetical protein